MSSLKLRDGVYVIRSAEKDGAFLSVDTASQLVDFRHVPVITSKANTKWKLATNILTTNSGGTTIQLCEQPNSEQPNPYVFAKKDDGVFTMTSTDKPKYNIQSDNSTDPTYYKIQTLGKNKNESGVFTSNGFMNQVTIAEDRKDLSQRWHFVLLGQYESYGSFFQQDTLNADEQGVGCVYPRFGLKLQYQWGSFWKSIADLNQHDDSADYKVFFLERHGEAINNDRPNGAMKSEMRDPQLVLEGLLQAQHVQSVWASELAAGIGLPQLSYCSPFTRTLATNTITFGNLPGISSLKTTIVENCREKVSPDEAEHRHRKKYIQEMLPSVANKEMLPSPDFEFEDNFAEYDPYWVHNLKDGSDDDSNDKPNPLVNPESYQAFLDRIQKVLSEIFENHKDATFVHITTHAGWIDGFCHVLGRTPYHAVNAVVLPIVVKAKNQA